MSMVSEAREVTRALISHEIRNSGKFWNANVMVMADAFFLRLGKELYKYCLV